MTLSSRMMLISSRTCRGRQRGTGSVTVSTVSRAGAPPPGPPGHRRRRALPPARPPSGIPGLPPRTGAPSPCSSGRRAPWGPAGRGAGRRAGRRHRSGWGRAGQRQHTRAGSRPTAGPHAPGGRRTSSHTAWPSPWLDTSEMMEHLVRLEVGGGKRGRREGGGGGVRRESHSGARAGRSLQPVRKAPSEAGLGPGRCLPVSCPAHLVPRPVPYSATRSRIQGLAHSVARSRRMLEGMAAGGVGEGTNGVRQLLANTWALQGSTRAGARRFRTFKRGDLAARRRRVDSEPPHVSADVEHHRARLRLPLLGRPQLLGGRRDRHLHRVQHLVELLRAGGGGGKGSGSTGGRSLKNQRAQQASRRQRGDGRPAGCLPRAPVGRARAGSRRSPTCGPRR
jgi:hypothetical protein